MSSSPERIAIDFALAARWTLSKFRNHAVHLASLAAVVVVVSVPQQLATRPLALLIDCTSLELSGRAEACAQAITTDVLMSVVIAFLSTIAALVATCGSVRCAVDLTSGWVPTFRESFRWRGLRPFFLAVVAVYFATSVGLMLCIIPGILVLTVLQLTPFELVNRGVGPIAAMKGSARVLVKRPDTALVLAAVNGLCFLLGGMFFGLLTLVTLPFACLFTAHIYRQLNAEPVV